MIKRMWVPLLVWGVIQAVALAQGEPTARELPRWRGFNLQEMFYKGSSTGPFKEEDFKLISEWGFNFVRLPMDYRIWIVDGDWNRFNETALQWVDQAVKYGQQYGVHVCLNFHRAPGYTVASPPEPTSLWTDPATQKVCASHWALFAKRYKGIPNSQLSFDLVNEPPDMDPNVYAQVVGVLVDAIRAEDPNRLAIADGINYGVIPCRNQTPHDVTLRWMEDCLSNWQQAGIGWALWNFRGSFGVLDSGRADVQYEDFRGHKLDRKMLDLLQRH